MEEIFIDTLPLCRPPNAHQQKTRGSAGFLPAKTSTGGTVNSMESPVSVTWVSSPQTLGPSYKLPNNLVDLERQEQKKNARV